MAGERGDLEPARLERAEVGLSGGFRREQGVDVDVGVARIVAGSDLDAVEPGVPGDVEDGRQRAIGVESGQDSELHSADSSERAGEDAEASLGASMQTLIDDRQT